MIYQYLIIVFLNKISPSFVAVIARFFSQRYDKLSLIINRCSDYYTASSKFNTYYPQDNIVIAKYCNVCEICECHIILSLFLCAIIDYFRNLDRNLRTA